MILIFIIGFIILYLKIYKKAYKFRWVIIASLIIRIVLSFIHNYLGHNLPDSGNGFTFMDYAFNLANGNINEILNIEMIGTHWAYSHLVAIFLKIFGKHLIIPIVINIFLGLLIIYEILSFLRSRVDRRTFKICCYLLVFSPTLAVYSTNFLREVFVVYFLVKSIILFLKYTEKKKNKYIYSSMFMLIVSSIFHPVAIVLCIIYLLYFLSSSKKIINWIPVLLVLSLLLFIAFSLGVGKYKLNNFYRFLENDYSSFTPLKENVYEGRLLSRNDVYFSTKISKNRVHQIILIPLKTLEIIGRPNIFDIRVKYDVAKFLETLVFMYFFYIFIKKYRFMNKITRVLSVSIIIFLIGVGLGSQEMDAGHRHRMKIYPLMVLSIGLVNNKYRYQNKRAEKKILV